MQPAVSNLLNAITQAQTTERETRHAEAANDAGRANAGQPNPPLDRPLPLHRPLPIGQAGTHAQPSLEFTRAPEGGWRPIQGADPFWRTDNLDPELANRWATDLHPFLLVQVMGSGADDPEVEEHGRKIEEITNKFLNLRPPTRTEFQYARPQVKPPAKNRAPYYHRIILPSESAKKTLRETGIIATDGFAIQFEEFRHELPTHQATYLKPHSFGVPFSATDREMEEAIRAIVQNAISKEPTREAIEKCVELDIATVEHSRWRHTTPAQAFDIIRRSVKAIVSRRLLANGGYESMVAIYCEAPASDAGRWHYFHHLFQSIPFGSSEMGSPILYTKEQHCAICHTSDHDTDACYLDEIPEWRGPKRQRRATNHPNTATTARGGSQRGSFHGGIRGGMRGGPRGRGGRR